jgi:hypothetical protein
MSQPVQPDEAANALSEVRRQQEQVINSVMVPGWYWWVTAGGISESGQTGTRRPRHPQPGKVRGAISLGRQSTSRLLPSQAMAVVERGLAGVSS